MGRRRCSMCLLAAKWALTASVGGTALLLSPRRLAATLATITIQYAIGYIPVIVHQLSLFVPKSAGTLAPP